MRIAFFGGVYNNHLALEAMFEDARRRGAQTLYCLGDIGGFGPHPDRSLELLRDSGIGVVQGNYDHSIGHGLDDCGCGYTDPRDNHYAQISYQYTRAKTSPRHLGWLRALPARLRVQTDALSLLLVHGSPRKVNEFLWESTAPDHLLERMLDAERADVLLCTHTGLPWQRRLPSGRRVVNVGAIGRPANDGGTHVWYALFDAERDDQPFELIPLAFDHERLAAEMRADSLPEEFVETILTGWWTTCLEILPARERLRGRY